MRFILDIANKTDSKPEMQKIIDFLSDEIATINCIDESNSNQFYEETEKNILTQKQIKTYNDIMMKKPTDIEELFDSLKPSKKEQAIIWLLSPVIVLATWALLIFICSL
jgi:hypothetical protein